MLNAELSNIVNERDKFLAELSECEKQVHYLDELCRVKDQEKEQLMNSYRKLIGEHERLDVILKGSSDETDNLRLVISRLI
jgi:hypothetical protein